MYVRRLQNVFSITMFCLPRRLEDVLQIRLEDVLEDKNLLRSRRHADVFKTSCRQTKCLLGISLSNKSKSVSDKSIFHLTNQGESKMH